MSVFVNKFGDIFSSKADAIGIPCNLVGAMGKGVAKQYASLYPKALEDYRKSIKNKMLVAGNVVMQEYEGRKFILIPTKYHWREKSDINLIRKGLIYLKNNLTTFNIKSIALPKLGAGNGKLKWEEVEKVVKNIFSDSDIEVEIWHFDENNKYASVAQMDRARDF